MRFKTKESVEEYMRQRKKGLSTKPYGGPEEIPVSEDTKDDAKQCTFNNPHKCQKVAASQKSDNSEKGPGRGLTKIITHIDEGPFIATSNDANIETDNTPEVISVPISTPTAEVKPQTLSEVNGDDKAIKKKPTVNDESTLDDW